MKNSKKGFTLVELLVVIAILAILASVSVVGYTKFIEKAAKSNDDALTTQINVLISGEKISQRQETFGELALSAILKPALGGPDDVVIQSNKYGYDIYWNEDINEFVLITIEEGTDKGWQTLLYILGLQQSITPPDITEPDILPEIPVISIPDNIIVDETKIINLTVKLNFDESILQNTTLNLSDKLGVNESDLSELSCSEIDIITYIGYNADTHFETNGNSITFNQPGVYKLTFNINSISDYRYIFVRNTYLDESSIYFTSYPDDHKLSFNTLTNFDNNEITIEIAKHLYGLTIGDYDESISNYVTYTLFSSPNYADHIVIIAKINDRYVKVEMNSAQRNEDPYKIVFENIVLSGETECEIYFRYLGMDGIWHNSETHEITIQ